MFRKQQKELTKSDLVLKDKDKDETQVRKEYIIVYNTDNPMGLMSEIFFFLNERMANEFIKINLDKKYNKYYLTPLEDIRCIKCNHILK